MYYTIEDVPAARETQTELACPHCKTTGKVEIVLLRTQISVGYIPMIGITKRAQAYCQHCGLPVRMEAGSPLKQAYKAFRRRTRTPIRYQIGMIGLLLVLFGIFAQMFYEVHHNPWDQKFDTTILATPQVGDLYEVEVPKQSSSKDTPGYTLARVEKVEERRVTLSYRDNFMPGIKPPMLDELLDMPGNYGDKIVVVKKPLRDKELFIPANGTNKYQYPEYIGKIYAARRP